MGTEQTAGTRQRLSLLGYLCAIALFCLSAVAFGQQSDDVLSRDNVLRDPEIPSLGNPKGDLTVVEYFDYQCPYCKKMAPELAQLAREDGNLRLVLKDWPIFGEISKSAAKLALAAKYQSKYAEAHDALIGADRKLTEANISEAARQGRRRRRRGHDGLADASKVDRRSVGAQRCASRGIRFSRHAGLHRRHVPGARRRGNEGIQTDRGRCPRGGEEAQILVRAVRQTRAA